MCRQIDPDHLIIPIFLLLSYFPLFLHLDGPPVFNWDESLFGMRMLYLVDHGRLLTSFSEYEGVYPIGNYKPPLITFLQALLFSLLGPDYLELSLRIPSALSTLGILILFLGISKDLTSRFHLGIVSGLILITSGGFLNLHIARTGDHDAPLAFLNLAALLAIWQYQRSSHTQSGKWYLFIFTLLVVLAFLTKTIAAFFFFPGILAYLIWKKRLFTLLKDPWIYVSAFALAGAIGAYYAYMNTIFPDFFRSEGGQVLRYTKTLSGHTHGFSYYLERLYTHSFFPWLLLLPFGIAQVVSHPKAPLKDLGLLFFLVCFFHYIIISFSATKLSWYDAYVIPLLSFLAALGLLRILRFAGNRLFPGKSSLQIGFWAVALVLIFLFPYRATLNRVYHHQPEFRHDQFGLLIQATRGMPEFREVSAYARRNTPQLALYKAIEKKRGRTIHIAHALKELPAHGFVLASHPARIDSLQQHFHTVLIRQKAECRLFQLNGRK